MNIEKKIDPKLNAEVRKIFTLYLEQNKQRKTPERFSILEEIYNQIGHFDAEELYLKMKRKSYNVSRATVYNTLELLVNSDLITKHQFGENHAQYEKAYGSRQHDHLICINCGKVIEFCEPRLQQIKESMSEIFDMEIKRHSLTLYGTCKLGCK
jgi:Fur family ferric uptake transcriptional regulator